MQRINLGNEYPCRCCYTCSPDCSLNQPDRDLSNQILGREELDAFLSEQQEVAQDREVSQ
jgi:hypothetical protein